MEATHTPGPWQWADVPSCGIQIRGPYKDSTRLLFQDIWRQFPEREWDAEMLANARLAAAAPELLAALTVILEHCGGYVPDTSKAIWRDAQAAVAKATGAQP